MGLGEGHEFCSNLSEPGDSLVNILSLLPLLFFWLVSTPVNILNGTCWILLTLFLPYWITQTVPGCTRKLHLGQVIDLEVIELDRWAAWTRKNKMVRMGLVFQPGSFVPRLKYSWAPRRYSLNTSVMNQRVRACMHE